MNHLFQRGLVVRYKAACWQFSFKDDFTLYFKSPPSHVTMFMSEDYFFEEVRRDRLVIVRLGTSDDRPYVQSILGTSTDTSGSDTPAVLEEKIDRRQRYVNAAISHLNGARRQVPFSLLPTMIAHELGEPNDAPSARALRRWLDAHFLRLNSLIEAGALFASLRSDHDSLANRERPPLRRLPDDTASDDD